MREVGVCHNFFPKFLPHSTEKNRTGTLLCFGKKPVSKKRTVNKGTSLLSVDTFLFHSAKTFRAETLRCFRKCLVSQIFFWWEKMGFVTIFFPSFCLTVRNKFVGEPFSVPEKIRYRKNLRIMGDFTIICWYFFVPQCQKNSCGNSSVFQKISGFANVFWQEKRGLYHDFLSKSLSHSTEKFRRGTLFVSENLGIFLGNEKRGCITICCQNPCLTVPENFVGYSFFVSGNFGYRKF